MFLLTGFYGNKTYFGIKRFPAIVQYLLTEIWIIYR